MAEQALALREYPQIVELLAVLEQSGLTKERDEVSSLVEYIDSMEEKLGQMMGELQEMHGEVQKIQDKGLYARCTRLLDTAQEKIAQTGTMVSTVKTNFVRAAVLAQAMQQAAGQLAEKLQGEPAGTEAIGKNGASCAEIRTGGKEIHPGPDRAGARINGGAI